MCAYFLRCQCYEEQLKRCSVLVSGPSTTPSDRIPSHSLDDADVVAFVRPRDEVDAISSQGAVVGHGLGDVGQLSIGCWDKSSVIVCSCEYVAIRLVMTAFLLVWIRGCASDHSQVSSFHWTSMTNHRADLLSSCTDNWTTDRITPRPLNHYNTHLC